MCGPENAGALGDLEPFDPTSKCCTYVPYVPNFLVGAMLAEGGAHESAVAALRERIAAGDAVTPLGVGRTYAERIAYDRAGFAFGRERTVRCPYYVSDGGLCGMWKSRTAVCSTWFCKHVQGARGRRLWVAVHQLFERVEWALAKHCAVELGIDGGSLGRLLAPLADRGWSRHVDGAGPAAFGDEPPAVWGDWDWRVEAYFLACRDRVAALAWADVRAIGGSDVAIAEQVVLHEMGRARSYDLPEQAKAAPIRMRPADATHDQVWTYSAYDPLTLPRSLVSALHTFDERPLRYAMRALHLDEPQVRELLDYEVLVPAARLARGKR
jgi:hypothetical protein